MASASTNKSQVSSPEHQRHDLFNVISLPIVILVNLRTILIFFYQSHDEALVDSAWNFQILSLNGYILVDSLYLIINPTCVSALKTVLFHHVIVFFGWLLVPHRVIEFRLIATCLLAVEINTFFMIARKYQPFQKYPTLKSLLRVGFYLTWIPLRLIIFPYCCYVGYYEALHFYNETGTLFNVATAGWLLLIFMTFLNIKWSVDLVRAHYRPESSVDWNLLIATCHGYYCCWSAVLIFYTVLSVICTQLTEISYLWIAVIVSVLCT